MESLELFARAQPVSPEILKTIQVKVKVIKPTHGTLLSFRIPSCVFGYIRELLNVALGKINSHVLVIEGNVCSEPRRGCCCLDFEVKRKTMTYYFCTNIRFLALINVSCTTRWVFDMKYLRFDMNEFGLFVYYSVDMRRPITGQSPALPVNSVISL